MRCWNWEFGMEILKFEKKTKLFQSQIFVLFKLFITVLIAGTIQSGSSSSSKNKQLIYIHLGFEFG